MQRNHCICKFQYGNLATSIGTLSVIKWAVVLCWKARLQLCPYYKTSENLETSKEQFFIIAALGSDADAAFFCCLVLTTFFVEHSPQEGELHFCIRTRTQSPFTMHQNHNWELAVLFEKCRVHCVSLVQTTMTNSLGFLVFVGWFLILSCRLCHQQDRIFYIFSHFPHVEQGLGFGFCWSKLWAERGVQVSKNW